jgi:hypothetical protein
VRREAKERKSRKRVEVARSEQVEKERAEQVCLIGTIYIEPLAS